MALIHDEISEAVHSAVHYGMDVTEFMRTVREAWQMHSRDKLSNEIKQLTEIRNG